MHPLQQYLNDHRLSQAELARRAGVHNVTISKVLSGDRPRFSAEAARAIEAATKGAVTFDQLWKPSARHRRGHAGGSS